MERSTQDYDTAVAERSDGEDLPDEKAPLLPGTMTVDEFTDYELDMARDLYRAMKGQRESVTIDGRTFSFDEIVRECFAEAFAEGEAEPTDLCVLACWLAWRVRADAVPHGPNPRVGP